MSRVLEEQLLRQVLALNVLQNGALVEYVLDGVVVINQLVKLGGAVVKEPLQYEHF